MMCNIVIHFFTKIMTIEYCERHLVEKMPNVRKAFDIEDVQYQWFRRFLAIFLNLSLLTI